jgi:hypothetical protein
VIGEQLKNNHTLMGIHLMGNYARVDELGFVAAEQTMDAASTHCFTRIPSKYHDSFNLLREPEDRAHIE